MEKDLINEADFGYRTDYLYSTPSFLSGFGSVMNLAGNYFSFNRSNSPEEADEVAIKNDFGVVGQDLRRAIEKVLLTYPELKAGH